MFRARIKKTTAGGAWQVNLLTVIWTVAILLSAAPAAWAFPFSANSIYIEVNGTDGDAGIQMFLDGEGWNQLEVTDPDGVKILDIQAAGSIGMQGITELFFESAEPSFEEQTLDELFELFPEGKYWFEGVTVEGQVLKGKATLTHAIPDAPVIVYPEEGETVSLDQDVVILWDPVVNPFPGTSLPVNIVGYQVIVENEGMNVLTFSADLSATATQVTVPWEFLEAGTAYKFEVLAIETSGNQTISESEFETR